MSGTEIRERLKEILKDAPASLKTEVEKLIHSLRKENQSIRADLEGVSKGWERTREEAGQAKSEVANLNEELARTRKKLRSTESALSRLEEEVIGAAYQPPEYDQLKQVGDGYLQVKVKCLKCGLHFLICTWYEDLHTFDTIHCPECGQKDGAYILWHERRPGEFIFQLVGGRAEFVGMNVMG